MSATQYLLSHWRAEQSLVRMTLVNGLLGYVLVLALGGILGTAPGRGVLVYPYALFFLAWGVWAIFGIGRAAVKRVMAPDESLLRKAGAALLFLAMCAISVIAAHDVWILMRA